MVMAQYSLSRTIVKCLIIRGRQTLAGYVQVMTPRCVCHYSTTSAADEDHRKRKLKSAENTHSTKHNLGMLKQNESIDTKKAYFPPPDVRARIEKIARNALSHCLESEWESTALSDRKNKFMFLTKLIDEFDHNIPNSTLSDLKTVGDAVSFFSAEVRATSTYEDLSASRDLPPNLSIQAEYLRFDPETDTMFGGRTAFPGRDTYVTSIKYRRKYSGITNTKEKPGYINYYYGY